MRSLFKYSLSSSSFSCIRFTGICLDGTVAILTSMDTLTHIHDDSQCVNRSLADCQVSVRIRSENYAQVVY